MKKALWAITSHPCIFFHNSKSFEKMTHQSHETMYLSEKKSKFLEHYSYAWYQFGIIQDKSIVRSKEGYFKIGILPIYSPNTSLHTKE